MNKIKREKMKKTTIQPLSDFLESLVHIEAKLKEQGFKMKVGRYDEWLYWTKGEKIKIPKIKGMKKIKGEIDRLVKWICAEPKDSWFNIYANYYRKTHDKS